MRTLVVVVLVENYQQSYEGRDHEHPLVVGHEFEVHAHIRPEVLLDACCSGVNWIPPVKCLDVAQEALH
jgi:hypothetical protein